MQFIKLFTPIFIAIFLILSDYKYAALDDIKQSINTLIKTPINFIVNQSSDLYQWIGQQGSTETKNTLRKRNNYLTSQIIELKTKLQAQESLKLTNKKLTRLLDVSYTVKEKKFTLVRVSNISQSRLKKQITINKGSNNGLKIGQVALGVEGVVGQITQVTPRHSTILMVTDPTQHIPVQNKRNGVRGISKGLASNQERLNVNFIESHLDVALGDIFLSSAVGSKFPAGLLVGEVTHVEKHVNDPFLHIQLTPTQSASQLEFLIIISEQ
jgi:rod shape-determining protein MreC